MAKWQIWVPKSLYYGSAVAVVVGIWLPLLAQFRTPSSGIEEVVIERSRSSPEESVLDRISGLSLLGGLSWLQDSAAVLSVADDILKGQARFPAQEPFPVSTSDPLKDFDGATAVEQRLQVSQAAVDVLVRAFAHTGRDELLLRARDLLFAWDRAERQSLSARIRVWNDHGMAARAIVLARFWRQYRHHPEYDPRSGQRVLEFVVRTGSLLSKPRLFTYSTNHGLMQNVALLHLSIAFPELPEVAAWPDVAVERLNDQLQYLMSPEGVILEHSPGYHVFGLELITTVFRYLHILDREVPEGWVRKFCRGLQFLEQLQRPDGTLPLFGDTHSGVYSTAEELRARSLAAGVRCAGAPPRVSHDAPVPVALYPTSGYAIWWTSPSGSAQARSDTRGDPSAQTVLTWSSFPGHGHQHLDEMSVSIWREGLSWLTNVGYWSYSDTLRSLAESRVGSNAPHFVDEASNPDSHTALKSFAIDDGVVVELERTLADGSWIRRQVIQPSPRLWIVLDAFQRKRDGTFRTVWTLGPGTSIERIVSGGYAFIRADSSSVTANVEGTPQPRLELLEAEEGRVEGWVIHDYDKVPTISLSTNQFADRGFLVTLFSFPSPDDPASANMPRLNLERWEGPDSWTMRLSTGEDDVRITRQHQSLRAERRSRQGETYVRNILLKASDVPAAEREHIHDALESARDKYQHLRIALPFRKKLTFLILVAFVVQEGLLVVVHRMTSVPRRWFELLCVILWLGGFATILFPRLS